MFKYGGQQQNRQTEAAYMLQKRALRTMNFKDINVTSYPLFQDSKILKSNDIVKVKDVIFVHDFVNKSLPK